MAIEGPLKELGIHDVFQLLDLSRKTGVLTVTSKLRHNQGTIYYDGGALVYAEILSNPHPLGGLLVRSGKITEGDLNRARDMQRQGDGRRLGELLVDIGAINARELERQVRAQIEEVVFEVMSWREGYFSFVEGPLPDIAADADVRIPTEALLMEGARRIDEWSRIESQIPHLGVIPTLAPAEGGEAGELDLLPTEWEVLAAVDGERDVRGISSSLGRSEFEVAKTIFGLATAGVVAVQDRGTQPAPTGQAEGEVDRLIERAAQALEHGDLDGARGWAESARAVQPHEASIYLILAEVELAAMRPTEAEEHLRRALRVDPMLVSGHRLLGDALALQGRFQEAVEWWQRWLKIGERSDDAAVADHVRRATEAAQTLDALLRRNRV